MSQTFNALNGQELKKAILASIELELDRCGEFKLNITYPWVRWDANVRVLSYPKQSMTDEPAINLTAVGEQIGAGVEKIPAGEPEVVLDLNLGRTVNTPDAEREKTSQPIPTQGVAAGGVTVDKPVLSPKSPLLKPVVKIDLQGKEIKAKPVDNGSPVGIGGIDGSAA